MNAVTNPAVVICDLDGTLVDSAPDIGASVDHALRQLGREALDLDVIRSYIGDGAGRLIHRALTRDVDGIADDNSFERASGHFYQHYEDNVCEKSALYPGVRASLCALRERGYALACVTNKPVRFTEPLLKALDLDEFFSVYLGGDSLAKKKPAPDQLLHVAAHHGVATANCVMVGDSITDVLAAQNANMQVICVSYGYGDIKEIRARDACAITDSFPAVVGLLDEELAFPQNIVDGRA